MVKATLKLEGLEAYLETLIKAGFEIDEVVEDGLDAGADVFIAGMQRRAPYPRLRMLVRKSGIGRDANKRYIYLGVLRDTDYENERIANTWEFGGPGKFGHGGKTRKHRRITAHPFIRPALRQDAGKARAVMADKFQKWLKK